MKCLYKNDNQILKCDSLWKNYERCVSDYSHKVLEEKEKSNEKKK